MRALTILVGLVSCFPASASQAAKKPPPVGLLPQQGHNGPITALTFHPGGRLVASGATDQTILVWDLLSGKIVRRFRGHFAPIRALAFSENGAKLFSVDQAAYYAAWDVASGAQLSAQSIEGARGIGVSPSGAFVAADDKAWRVYDGATGKRRIEAWLNKPRRTVFSFDGRYAATVGDGGRRVVLDLDSSEQYVLPDLSDRSDDVAFSSDGKWLALGREKAAIALWNFESATYRDGPISGHLVGFSKDALFSADGAVLSRASPSTWKPKPWSNALSHVDRIEALAVGPDGKTIAVAGQGGVSLFDVGTGDRTLVTGVGIALESVALDPAGSVLVQKLASGSGTGKSDLRIWSLKEMKPIRMVRSIRGWFFAESGALLTQDGNRLGELPPGARGAQRVVELPKVCDCAALIGGPGDTLICIPAAGSLHIFTRDGKLLFDSVGGAGVISSFAISFDRKLLALGRPASRSIELIDLVTGKTVRSFAAEGTLEAVLFANDSARVFTCCTPGETMEVFDAASGARSARVEGAGRPIAAIADNVLGWNPRTTRVGLYSAKYVSSESFVRALDWGPSPVASGAAATRDGKWIALGRKNGEVLALEVRGTELVVHERMRLHSSDVVSLNFTGDGKFLASSATDGSSAIYEVRSKKKLWLLAQGDEWLIYSSDGWFDASRKGGDLAAMVQGDRGFGVDQLALRYNRPDLLIQTFGGDGALIDHFRMQSEKRLRKAGLSSDADLAEIQLPVARITGSKKNGKYLELDVDLEDSATQLSSFNLYVNDVPVWGLLGKKTPKTKRHKTKTRVELSPGPNKVEVSAFNVAGIESFRALVRANREDTPRGSLYFLGFGVSKYRDSSLDLSFAHKDALDLGARFAALGGQYDSVIVKTFVDDQVTVPALKQAKKLLAGAKPEDTFVLFIAGHGKHAEGPEATYYYLTHEADVRRLDRTAAPFELIEELLQDVAPRKKLFLLDTCESGELDPTEAPVVIAQAEVAGNKARGLKRKEPAVAPTASVRSRPYLLEKDRYIYNDLARRSGAIVFSSSRGGELSFERADVQNGLFTEEILTALGTSAADRDRDGKVSSSELRAYVSEAVAKSSGDLQHPTVDRDNISLELSFPLPR